MRTCSLLRSVFALTLTGFAGLAHAAEEGNATLTFNLPALSYGSSNAESKPEGGSSAKSKTDTMATQDLGDSYAMIGFGSCTMYFYPFNDLKVVSFGYLPSSLYEVGIDLGLNNSKTDKPKNESNSTLFGVYGYVYPKLGSTDSEVGLIIDTVTEKGTTTTFDAAGVASESKTNETSMQTKLIANAIIPIRKNLNYVGGIWYKMNSADDKEGKVKNSESGFGLNLMTMRITL